MFILTYFPPPLKDDRLVDPELEPELVRPARLLALSAKLDFFAAILALCLAKAPPPAVPFVPYWFLSPMYGEPLRTESLYLSYPPR